MKPLDKLKYHVTGAIERGEKQAIVLVTNETREFNLNIVEMRLNTIITNLDGQEANHWYRLKVRLRAGQKLTPKMAQNLRWVLEDLEVNP